MNDKEIIDLFYNYIIKEATTGRINSYMYYNIPFEVIINNEYITKCNCNYEGVEIPTLKINNKELFDKYLILYVKKARMFYSNDNFPEELNGDKFYDDNILISKEKSIICSLLANATYDDFLNPLNFLKSRIEMFDNPIINLETKDLGHSNILKGRVVVEEQRDHIYNETPYVLKTKIVSDDMESEYYLPDIRIGKNNNETIIYSIQNTKKNEDNKYTKYVSRTFRRVDSGLDVKNDNEENYGIGNLKDITPSFLVTAVIALSLIKDKKITIPSLLISRWNAKRIAILRNKAENKNEYFEKQVLLQKNISEKFIRTFRRIAYHFNGIDIDTIPFDLDSSMRLSIKDTVYSENNLLNELYQLNNIEKEATIIHK